MEGLAWQPMFVPLAAGLAQKTDDRARQPPSLEVCLDAQFDEVGGLQLRKPWGIDPVGAIAVSAGCRLAAYDDELIAFLDGQIYSLDNVNHAWKLKGEHLAVKVQEAAVGITTDDQVRCDRAELGNIILYTWEVASAQKVYVQAVDKTTGNTIVPPTLFTDAIAPRVIAVSTRIVFLWVKNSTGDLKFLSIDPANVATSLAGVASTPIAATNKSYDATRIIGTANIAVIANKSPTTSYALASLTEAGGINASNVKARSATGVVAISSVPVGGDLQVVRADGTNIKGDRVTSALADTASIGVVIATLSGGGANSLAAAHRSVQNGGQFRCYVFWDEDTASAGDANNTDVSFNYIDTAGAIGATAVLVRRMGVASRAFDFNGSVFLWTVFAGASTFTGANDQNFPAQLENTYFLYRDDGFLSNAKAAVGRAGGFAYSTAPGSTPAPLPGVQLLSGKQFAWCGTERRIIELGNNGHRSYADRGPRDIVFTFHSPEARRTARLGKTLYIAGGEILQYDGAQLTEVGYHIYPWAFGGGQNGAGSLANGTYAYKQTARWDNAKGELDRSTTATALTVTIAAGPAGVQMAPGSSDYANIHTTHKTSTPIALEFWRTPVNPTADSDFFLTTSKDPSATVNPNRYLPNDTTAVSPPTFRDQLDDATLLTKEGFSENDGVLENLAPPPATIIVANDLRLFLAGVAGDPNRVWYSKQRTEGQVAAFNDALVIDVPIAGGDITALAFLNETLIVFRETAIYALSGDGFDNVGGGQNYGPARIISTDLGATVHESVAFMPDGLVFKSSKGWMLLDRGWNVEEIGDAIADYDSEAPVAVHVVESQQQVRVVTANRVLVWDYRRSVNQWSEWTAPTGPLGFMGAIGSCIWRGKHTMLIGAGLAVEDQSGFAELTNNAYGIDVETAWIKVASPMGQARVRSIQLLGEYRGVHHLRIRAAYNYDPTFVDDKFWTSSPAVIGGPLQVKFGPSQQQLEAIKLRITAYDSNEVDPPDNEALKLTGIALEVGQKQGLFTRLPAAQRT